MGLAPVVVEEHARRAVHLRDDHPFGAVDDEGAVVRHQRHVAHIDVLLLDVADRPRAGIVVEVEDDQAQGYLQRRGVGHAPLLAFLDIVFGLLELVFHEFELRLVGEILDRKDGRQHLLQARLAAPLRAGVALQESFIGGALHVDQIRNRRHLADMAEILANPLAARKRHRHVRSTLFHADGRSAPRPLFNWVAARKWQTARTPRARLPGPQPPLPLMSGPEPGPASIRPGNPATSALPSRRRLRASPSAPRLRPCSRPP